MKRILSAMLILSLLVLRASPSMAQAGSNLNHLLGANSADSLAAADGALWLLSGDRLWRWQPGDQEAALIAQGVPNAFHDPQDPGALGHLMAHENRLYSLHPALGLLSEWLPGEHVQLRDPIRYPLDLLLDADGMPRMIKNCAMNGRGVWLLAESRAGDGFDLLLLDRQGGVHLSKAKHIRSIAPYEDNSLLAIVREEGQNAQIVRIDPETGAMKTLIGSVAKDADGLCHDQGSNTAYYVSEAQILAHPKMGKAQRVAYLPAVYLYRSPVLIGGHMAVSLPDGVYIRSLSADTSSKPTVRVYTWDPFTLSKLRAMLPGINIEASSSVMNSTELAQAVISDAFDYDVALLNIRDPQLYSLMDKGYLMDLRPFAELARLSERIYPVFLEPVTRERRLFALPASVSITTYGYDPDVLSRIGLTADQLPRDILSFLDFLGGWRADFGGFDGEILPAIGLDRRSVTHDMVTLYIDQHLMQGLPLSFDTPLFRRMMEKIDSLDYSYLSGLWDLIPQESRDVPKAVIQPFVDLGSLGRNRVSPASDGTREYPLSIGLTPDGGTIYPFQADFVTVMTRAKDPEAAARVAAAYVQADWTQTASQLLFMDYGPSVSENYLENLRTMEENERSLKAQAEKAEGAEKTHLEQSLADFQKRMADYEVEKYVVTEDELEEYRRDTLPYLRPLAPSIHEDANRLGDLSFLMLVRQLVDGQLDAASFITQADQMLRLMALEEGR